MSRVRVRAGLVTIVAAALLLTACSGEGDDGDAAASTTTTSASRVSTGEPPSGRRAELTRLSGGDGVFVGAAKPTALPSGYIEAGIVLREDRAAIEAYAHPELVTG